MANLSSLNSMSLQNLWTHLKGLNDGELYEYYSEFLPQRFADELIGFGPRELNRILRKLKSDELHSLLRQMQPDTLKYLNNNLEQTCLRQLLDGMNIDGIKWFLDELGTSELKKLFREQIPISMKYFEALLHNANQGPSLIDGRFNVDEPALPAGMGILKLQFRYSSTILVNRDLIQLTEKASSLVNFFTVRERSAYFENLSVGIRDVVLTLELFIKSAREFCLVNAGKKPVQEINGLIRPRLIGALTSIVYNFSPFVVYQMVDVQNRSWEIEQAGEKISQIEKDAEALKTSLDEVKKIAGDMSGTIGAATQDSTYNILAERIEKRCVFWLIATGGLAAFALAVAVLRLFWPMISCWLSNACESELGAHAYLNAAASITIIGLFATAAYWCGTIYRTLIQESFLYRQKGSLANNFSLYKKAAEVASKSETEVILEAARASFQVAPTGFGKHQQGDNNSISVRLSGVSSDNNSNP